MINLAICGIFGKMGNAVFNLAQNDEDFKIIFGVDKRNRENTLSGGFCDGLLGGFCDGLSSGFCCGDKNIDDLNDGNKNLPIFDSFEKINLPRDKEKFAVDVIIDFSSPSTLENVLLFAEKHKSATILATTGYSEKDFEIIKFYSQKIPIFYSQNLSLGIYSLINACKKICDNFFDFDVEIIEKHHNKKKDAPSGTAIKIANEISPHFSLKNNADGNPTDLNDKSGCLGEKINGIPIHSVRGGGIFGEHEVLFMSGNEIISVKHTALNRDLFARSALNIAKFIAHMPSGLYGMNDYAEYVRYKNFKRFKP